MYLTLFSLNKHNFPDKEKSLTFPRSQNHIENPLDD